MNYPLSQCKATVEMSLEQIVDIEKAFTRAQELEKEVHDTKLQLAEAKEDLRIICKNLYVSHSRDSVWIDNFDALSPEEKEAFILTVKRNKHV